MGLSEVRKTEIQNLRRGGVKNAGIKKATGAAAGGGDDKDL